MSEEDSEAGRLSRLTAEYFRIQKEFLLDIDAFM